MRDGARGIEEKDQALEAQLALQCRTNAEQPASLSDEDLITKAPARTRASPTRIARWRCSAASRSR